MSSMPYGTRTARTLDGLNYAPGALFRVTREGLKLAGMLYEGRSSWGGWSQDLHPGDVLTCTGFGPGWGGDPGYGIEFTTAESRAAGASHCDIHPMAGSLFDYRPPAGTLESAPSEVAS